MISLYTPVLRTEFVALRSRLPTFWSSSGRLGGRSRGAQDHRAPETSTWPPLCGGCMTRRSRCASRVVGACFPLDSRLLSRLRRPVGCFNTELLGVLRVQPLPTAELHGV